MPIAVQCSCGKRFKADESHLGKKCKCPACGATLTIAENPSVKPGPKPCLIASPAAPLVAQPPTIEAITPSTTALGQEPPIAPVAIRLRCKGGFYWPLAIRVSLDGQPIGTGTCRRGFDLDTATTLGSHKLEATLFGQPTPFAVHFAAPGTYEVELRLRGWTSGFPDKFSDRIEVCNISGPTPAQAISGLESAAGSISTAQFFYATFPNRGAIGFFEQTLGTESAPAYREAKVEVQSGELVVAGKDSTGEYHEVFRQVLSELVLLATARVTLGQQRLQEVKHALLVGLSLGVAIIMGIVASLGWDQIRKDFASGFGAPLLLLGIGLGLGQVFGFGFTFLRGRGRKQLLTELRWKTSDGKQFAVLVNDNQLAVGLPLLKQFIPTVG